MKRWAAGLLVGLSLTGCGDDTARYFPSDTGSRWSYTMRSGLISRVEEVSVLGAVSAGDTTGVRLAGPMGESVLFWKDHWLMAETLAGTRFDPALPILLGSRPGSTTTWHGTVTVAGRSSSANATITQAKSSYKISGRSVPSLIVKTQLKSGGHVTAVDTWFAEGIGIVKQDQSRDDRWSRSLEYVSGP